MPGAHTKPTRKTLVTKAMRQQAASELMERARQKRERKARRALELQGRWETT